MSKFEIASSDNVREGDVLIAKAGERAVALTRINGAVRAFENKCPHLGLSLAKGKIEGGAIQCPWHGSRFDVCSGKNLDWVNSFVGMPLPKWTHGLVAMGKSPQPLKVFPASEASGKVFVEIAE